MGMMCRDGGCWGKRGSWRRERRGRDGLWKVWKVRGEGELGEVGV
jgi:hypothetical protein